MSKNFPVGLLLPALFLAVLEASCQAQGAATAVYLMNVDGSQARLLVRVDGYEQHTFPRWSHDGKMVAFDAQPTGTTVRHMFVVNVDGSGLRAMGLGSTPYWSPDDKQIAFYFLAPDGRPQLAVQNLDGNGRTDLGSGKSPCFSPDGSRMATTDTKNVSIIDMASGEIATLFSEPYVEVFRGFDFTPDGKRLAITVLTPGDPLRHLLLVDRDGADKGVTLRLKADLGGFVSFSPDGNRLMYASDYEMKIVEVDSDKPPQPVPGQRGRNFHPDWSPDGRSVVFVSDRDGK